MQLKLAVTRNLKKIKNKKTSCFKFKKKSFYLYIYKLFLKVAAINKIFII